MNKLQISQKSVQQIMIDEGCVLYAYKDSGGIWTIGCGHTQGVKPGDTITKVQAITFLTSDCQNAVKQVNDLNLPFNQNQFDAVVQLVYNIGIGRFQMQQLYKVMKLNVNDATIHDLFLNTCVHDAKGTVLSDLQARRKRNADLYITPIV